MRGCGDVMATVTGGREDEMSIDKQAAFSIVGLEYAKRYKELTAARETFQAERRKMLMELAGIVSVSLKDAGLVFSQDFAKKPGSKPPVPKEDAEWWTWNINRSYAQAWNGQRKKADRKDKRSGVHLWLAEVVEGMSFGLYALVWLADEKDELFDDDDIDDDG
jgi:hypothetical protein